MQSFLAACAVAIVIAIGAAVILNKYYQVETAEVYTSPASVRI